MIEKLIEKVQLFTCLLDQGVKCGEVIKDKIQEEKWEQVETLINNRERLLKIIGDNQDHIEKIINCLFDEELTPVNINIVKSWAFDTQKWIDQIASIDLEIDHNLQCLKNQTTQQIATLFRSKEAMRGYSLKELRRYRSP